MNFFLLREWWRYRRAAKGRHGVHSPFVYRFIDEALRPRRLQALQTLRYQNAEVGFWQGNDLMQRVVWYLHPESIEQAGYCFIHSGETQPVFRKLIIWQDDELQMPAESLSERLSAVDARDVVAINHIHHLPEQAASWHVLQAHSRVTLSIDFFETGLLFFSKDFKEQQHFVLKYPA